VPLLLFAHSHDSTSNTCTLSRHTRISYLNLILKDILSAVHLYRNYPTYNVIYVYDIYYIYFRRERNLSVHSISIIYSARHFGPSLTTFVSSRQILVEFANKKFY